MKRDSGVGGYAVFLAIEHPGHMDHVHQGNSEIADS